MSDLRPLEAPRQLLAARLAGNWRAALVALGLALALAVFYRASFQLPITALGLALFAALALLRPDLALLFVPLTVPLYLMPKGIWDARFGIRDAGLRVPLHEVVLLTTLAATALRGLLARFQIKGLSLRELARPRREQLIEAELVQSQTIIRRLRRLRRLRVPNLRNLRNLRTDYTYGRDFASALLIEAAPIVLFLAAATLGLALALPEGRGEALRQWRWLIVEPVLFYVLARLLGQRHPLLRWQLVAALALAGAAVAAIGLLQYRGSDLTPWIGQRMSHVDSVIVIDGVRRVTSVYGHPNNLGLFLGRVWPLGLALAASLLLAARRDQVSGTRAPLLLGASGCVLLALLALLGLIITYSRGANSAALAAGAVLGWGLLRQVRGTSSRLTIALGLGLLAALLVVMFRDDPASGSVNTRLLLWREALAMLRDHPLGIGPGQFYFYHSPEFGHGYIAPALLNTSEQYAAHPHNLVLDVLLQLGPLGLLALAWLLWRFVQRALATQQQNVADALLLLGLLAGMTAALVHGAVDNFYFVPDLALFFWLALACAPPYLDKRQPSY